MVGFPEGKEVDKNLCKKCVKAKWLCLGDTQKVKCMVLKRPIGLTGACWAYSDDPEFWTKVNEAISNYKKGVFQIG